MKNERKMLRAVVLVVAAGAIAALSACNTVSGVGKDLQEGSKNVKEAIEN
jgi:predicted small secreted protein